VLALELLQPSCFEEAFSFSFSPPCCFHSLLRLVFSSGWLLPPGGMTEVLQIGNNTSQLLIKIWETSITKKKIPIEEVVEAYLIEKVEFKKDLYEILLKRNQLFRFCFSWNHAKFYIGTFLRQNFGHSTGADHSDIHHVYNRGNDFYGWFLGETMIYTSGVFEDEKESLEVAQRRKMDLVCQYTQMKKGDKHLDIGCGWGSLLVHAAKKYGTSGTGVTLAEEQSAFGAAQAKDAKVLDRVRFLTMDYRKIPNEKYDKITCLEMAEHVGIKNFHTFLRQVYGLLNDDGIFYLQIAGLRRAWQFEDLVWGLFMGKYIFPGADASCPLGFVVNHLEKAGFEVHRVENCGVHYSLTIAHWYNNWKSNKEKIVEKYSEWWYRLWMVFLAWSTIIAAQGSSTVFFITATKNLKNDVRTVTKQEAFKINLKLNRLQRWIGGKPLATQR